MDTMPQPPAHAKPVPKRDHLWVLVIIAGFAMYDVWGAWAQIGNKSGFAHGTGWTLTVIAEAYWGYALFAWFRAPGRRSRRFAMWSAAAVFVMSAVSQAASHLAADRVPPAAVVVFVSVLPVTVLALIAVLVHLRMKDREDAAETEERSAVQAEMDTLRAELAQVRDELSVAHADRDEAQRQAEEATAKAERLARKPGARKPSGRRTKQANASANGRRRTAANEPANGEANAPAETQVPDDVDARTEALGIYLANPKISGKDLGNAVGLGARWGQLRKIEFAASVPARQDPEE